MGGRRRSDVWTRDHYSCRHLGSSPRGAARICYAVRVPQRACHVTVTDERGQRHTTEVLASSVNRAACYYFARSRSSPAEQLPRVADGTIYEVQPVGESTVYCVEHRRMLRWANRVAEQQWTRTA